MNSNENWDYRLENPILVTTADEYGEFSAEIDDMANIFAVILHPNYSFRITDEVSEDMSIILYQDLIIQGAIDYNIEVNENNNLVVVDDCTFLPRSSLVIKGNSTIRIEPDKSIVCTL